MAQTTSKTKKSSSAKPKSSATKAKPKAKPRTAAAKSRSSASRSSNGSAPKAKKRSSSSASSRSKSSAQSRNGSGSFADTAVEKTKAAGHAAADAASKAKTPLIAGGTALAGAAAGLAIKSRVDAKRSKNPLKRLGAKSISPPKGFGLDKLDLKSMKSTAEKLSAYGQQAADIAAAAEKTNKKNG